jgi:Nitrile hydratase, alpha chain
MADDNRFGEIISKCWGDAAFKKRFLSEPAKVLAEFGMDVPDGLNVKVVENTGDTMFLTLPVTPDWRKPTELSDAQLDAVSGGAGGALKPQVMQTRPQYVNLTKMIKVATSVSLNTCSQGKECIPW